MQWREFTHTNQQVGHLYYKKMKEAVEILIQVANLAQQRGILTLEDAVIVANAIKIIKEDDKV